MEILLHRGFGQESGCKNHTFGISSHCYNSIYTSSYLKHPSAPWEGGIKPQASRWLFTQWASSLLQALHQVICSYCRKENSKDKKVHREVLACGFSAQVRLGPLCKWPRIRSDLSLPPWIKPYATYWKMKYWIAAPKVNIVHSVLWFFPQENTAWLWH